MTETQETPRLSVLLSRVRQEEAEGSVKKETLLSIAKGVLCNYGTIQECREAVDVLARYRLAKLANTHPKYRAKSWDLIQKEESKPYERRCCRCGLPISSEKSLETGLGRVCRHKASTPRTSEGS
jgi:hypothetical protein